MPVKKEKIESIELLRILAALGICFYHLGCYQDSGIGFPLGINLLFCVSGFLLLTTTEQPKKHFLLKRLLRILPLYWLLTLGCFAAARLLPGLFGEAATLPELIKSLLLIPYKRAGMQTESVTRPIVGPGWTMYYDVCFAILFAIAMKLRHKWRGAITAGLCCLLMLGALLPDTNSFLHVFTKRYWLDFMAGMACCPLWKRWKTADPAVRESKLLRLGAGLAALGGLVIVYSQKQIYPLDAAACFVILMGTMICLDGVRLPKAVLFLGKLSYSFYLLHYFVILVLGKFFDFSRLTFPAIAGTAAVILLSYIAAWISYELIERRFTGWVIGKLDRKKPSEP